MNPTRLFYATFEKIYQLEEAKKLLRKDWYEINKQGPHSTGFCYIAAECAFHLLGGKEAGYTSYYAVYEEEGRRCTHWWLKKGKKIIDPTKSQYTYYNLTPPYHLGKGAGFLTKEPSQRAKKLIELYKRFSKSR